jgi:Fe-S-cluster-containing hydrogenase component 2
MQGLRSLRETLPDGSVVAAGFSAGEEQGKASVLEADRCIGCGVCAYKCPTGSLALVSRGAERAPPQDPRDYVNRFLTEWQAHTKEAGAKS